MAFKRGRAKLGRKTQRERFRKRLVALGVCLKALREQGTHAMQEYVRQHLVGHIQYYGVSGNSRSVGTHVFRVGRLLFKWRNNANLAPSDLARCTDAVRQVMCDVSCLRYLVLSA
jgi:hypothetical protein